MKGSVKFIMRSDAIESSDIDKTTDDSSTKNTENKSDKSDKSLIDKIKGLFN